MRRLPYRLLAALTITLTLGGCVTYPSTPVVVGNTYVREAPPVYSYSVITDPGYRYYDDTLGVYVFYDRSDVFYRQGHYYRWHHDHWISASHWGGRWHPAPNFYISANFNDRWHTRLRRHGHRYAGGHHHKPPRRQAYDDGYKRRDRHDSNPYRYDRREKGKDRREERENRGWDGANGFVGVAKPKGRAFQADSRSGDRRNDRRKDRGSERRNPGRNVTRDERVVKVEGKPTGIRDPRIVSAVDRPANDRRAVRDTLKPQSQRAQPQRQSQRKAPNERRNTAAKPAPRQERKQPKNEQPKKKEKNSKKNADNRKQVHIVREPRTRRSNEARRQID
ncbi:hypothetical protein [uncultured Microbulbifer sp.]|uniref:hypothetical protein n=1 Tax=uncultured Microbulbifer sp. TaxID=348147 RepID=UPI0026020DC6|nr:hypothetical protein [uncultured Microbulbifer sp.]